MTRPLSPDGVGPTLGGGGTGVGAELTGGSAAASNDFGGGGLAAISRAIASRAAALERAASRASFSSESRLVCANVAQAMAAGIWIPAGINQGNQVRVFQTHRQPAAAMPNAPSAPIPAAIRGRGTLKRPPKTTPVSRTKPNSVQSGVRSSHSRRTRLTKAVALTST